MTTKQSTKFIFITGGVISSLGKGLASASLASCLQERGYSVKLKKLDPYLNIDPGTMSPSEHGEVFVTEDGSEVDLDLGHYERFTDINTSRYNNITSGQIYEKLLKQERKGSYLGGTAQTVPHVTNLIKEFIFKDTENIDFVLCEIGGTVGDIEGQPFYEATRQLRYKLGKQQSLFIHVSYIPFIKAAKELKTKPTQHSVKELRSIGIQPNIILCRTEYQLPQNIKQKIALFCNVTKEDVIQAIDVASIYEAPINYNENNLDNRVLQHFGITQAKKIHLKKWHDVINNINNTTYSTTISVIGKYTEIFDAYKSIIESLTHASIENKAKLYINWIDAEKLNEQSISELLKNSNGVLVPGGFGIRGAEGKIQAIKYARKNNIPYLGICFGMQMAVIEFARNVLNIKDASSSEFGKCKNPIVGLMTQWQNDTKLEKRGAQNDIGGTMRLGSYDCVIDSNSKAYDAYKSNNIKERHRHRYEVNISYKEKLEAHGMIFSGLSPDRNLPEIIELKNHKWFVACQFHPEFKSRPFKAHPLFREFIKAGL